MLSCRQIYVLVGSQPLETLPWRTRIAVRFHYALCRMCRRHQAQLRLLDALVERQARLEMEPLPSGARERLKEAIKGSSDPAAAGQRGRK